MSDFNSLTAAARLAAYGIEPGERIPHGMLYLESSSQAKTGDSSRSQRARRSAESAAKDHPSLAATWLPETLEATMICGDGDGVAFDFFNEL